MFKRTKLIANKLGFKKEIIRNKINDLLENKNFSY